jgi:KDO2-lipid IV(A) lauroyltransferase
LAALWIVSRLPWRLQRVLADALGWVAFHLVRIRRGVVETNLRICFPQLGEPERGRLARRHYQSLALGILEVARCWWRDPAALPTHRIEGLELLRAAAAKGKGVLLVSGHFTTLEITGRMLSLVHPIACLYRDPNNPVLAAHLRRHRSAWATRAIEMRDLKGLLGALRAGEVVWYAPDQGKRTAQSELLPFFGEPCITNTSTPRLAEMTGAAVLTFHARREADGSYTLALADAPAGIPSGDPAADTVRLVRELEGAVRAAPEQYLWVHRRFKAREGMQDPYA